MAMRVLQSLAELGCVPESYLILEVSADLADRQRSQLQQLPAELRDRVSWLERLPETPLRGLILANEVLDALPCERFEVHAGRARQLGVGLEGSRLTWQPGASGAFDVSIDELPIALADGYRSEVCWRIEPWLAGVGRCLEQGVMLLFDYGLPRAHYYHPQRTDGTLRCYFKHRAHEDPFINIGVQDITAWVDFTRVAEAAVAAELEVSGFATQAGFLLGTGIEELAAAAADVSERTRLAGEARRLLLPGEMGEAFKVMALCRNLQQPLRGFAYQDLRRSL